MAQAAKKKKKSSASSTRSSQAKTDDIVQNYLADVRQHEVLSREEEQEIAYRYIEDDDDAAEQKLVNSNLRLVVKIAMEYKSGRVNVLDLIQEGNVGLIHAVRKFDPDKNIRLASYAQWWIRAYILKFLMDNHKLVKVGTTQAQRKLFYNLKKHKEKLLRQGIVPSAPVLARALDVRVKDVREMEIRLAGAENSLDAPLREGESGSLGDLISEDGPLQDHTVERSQTADKLKEYLDEFAATLDGRDVDIWHRRMVADNPRTLQEIGDLFGVSRERARQLEARIVKRLDKYLKDRVGETESLQFPLFA
jgi:RNA polymerase sigma-32 factor